MDNNVLYEIKPKFNFIYEIGMPTGVKIKKTVIAILMILIMIFGLKIMMYSNITSDNINVIVEYNLGEILNSILLILLAIVVIKLIVHIIVQYIQYKNLSYTFYDDSLIYEDSFLNQQRKTLMYSNIKEIEIRRSIWDRINGRGMIIIYTNAEKSYSKGLIIYSIKNTQAVYDKVSQIIYTANNKDKNNMPSKNDIDNESSYNEDITKSEEDFKNSLRN